MYDYEVVGITCNGEIYHRECAPECTPFDVIFADDESVDEYTCAECGNPLVEP